MRNFEYYFDNFTFEMHNMAYNNFIKTNREYIDVDNSLNRLEEKFNKLLGKLNEEDKKFLIDYIDKYGYKVACSGYEMYVTGYKDCVKLLKKIGAI